MLFPFFCILLVTCHCYKMWLTCLCYFLSLQELHNYLSISTSTSVIVDRSCDEDYLRIDFNIRYAPLQSIEILHWLVLKEKFDCSISIILSSVYYVRTTCVDFVSYVGLLANSGWFVVMQSSSFILWVCICGREWCTGNCKFNIFLVECRFWSAPNLGIGIFWGDSLHCFGLSAYVFCCLSGSWLLMTVVYLICRTGWT